MMSHRAMIAAAGAFGASPANILSVTPSASGNYYRDAALSFVVVFSEVVIVNISGGTPYINITLDTFGNSTAHAAYTSGSGTNTLTFTYTIQGDDYDATGIAIATSITPNGGTIKNSGVDSNLSYGSINTSGIKILGVDWSTYDTSSNADGGAGEATLISQGIRSVYCGNKIWFIGYSVSGKIRGYFITRDKDGGLTKTTPVQILDSGVSTVIELDLILLNTGNILCFYKESSANLKAFVFTFSGTTISTVGSTVTVLTNTNSQNYIRVTALTTTDVLFCHTKATSAFTGKLTYASVSGTVITVGNSIDFPNGANTFSSIAFCKLAAGKTVAVYGTTGIEYRASLVYFSGTTPTFSGTVTVKDASITPEEPAIGRIDDNNAVIAYTDTFNNVTYGRVLNESGGTLTLGSEQTVAASLGATGGSMDVIVPQTGVALIGFKVKNSTTYDIVECTYSGTSLTVGTNNTSIVTMKNASYSAHLIQIEEQFLALNYIDANDDPHTLMVTP